MNDKREENVQLRHNFLSLFGCLEPSKKSPKSEKHKKCIRGCWKINHKHSFLFLPQPKLSNKMNHSFFLIKTPKQGEGYDI